MNDERSFERTARAWLEPGANQAPDRAIQAVLLAIETTPQERDLRIPWRFPRMNKLVAVGLGTAAVVVALFVGSQLLGPPAPSGVGGAPPITPSPTAVAPTAEPSVPVPVPSSATDGYLPEGPFLVVDQGSPNAALSTTVSIPASGWTSAPEFGGVVKGDDVDNLPEAAMLAWSWPAGTAFSVYDDPCRWASTTRPPASTVDEIATALAAQASRDASDPVDVTVGGYAGKRITLHVPSDATFADCDQSTFASYGIDGGEPSRFHQGPGQVDELWILDVDGAFVVLDVMYRPDTPAELVEELRAIARSATFKAP
jgi:hypothetical protein